MPSRELKVSVCSTSKDLHDYRGVARNEILDLGWHPEMMEHFGAIPQETVQACREKVAACDVMLLIVGFRRGWVPTKEEGGDGASSVTAFELEYAHERRIPVLILRASEKSPWPRDFSIRRRPGAQCRRAR